jgi:hypothetical protein
MKYLMFIFLIGVSYSQCITYEDLEAYEKECFADSSLVHTYNPKWYDSCYQQTGNMADGYSFELVCKNLNHFTYVHREPTWEGFREFVKNKTLRVLQVR